MKYAAVVAGVAAALCVASAVPANTRAPASAADAPPPPVDAWGIALALGRFGYRASDIAMVLSEVFPVGKVAVGDAAQALAAGTCQDGTTSVQLTQALASMHYASTDAKAAIAQLGPNLTPTALARLGSRVLGYPLEAQAAAIKSNFKSMTCNQLADALAPAYCGANWTHAVVEPALIKAGCTAADAYAASMRYFDQYHVTLQNLPGLLRLEYPGTTVQQVGPILKAQKQFADTPIVPMAQALAYGFCNATAASIVDALLLSNYTRADVAGMCYGGAW